MFNVKFCSVLAIASALVAIPASAGVVGGTVTPLMEAGAPTDVDGPGTADSTVLRIDPNVPTSPYSGVVSLNIRYSGQSFICSGTLIDATHVLTAGHCTDTDGQGHVIDVSQSYATSGRDVRVIFNATAAGAGASVVTASNAVIHPDYAGFGNCPAGVTSFCVNDDISIVTLSQPAPIDAQIYAISRDAQAEGTSFTLVGYGTTGNGWSGYTAGSAAFRTKRSGTNTYDLTDADDEQGFTGQAEVWYADFDGTDVNGNQVDSFCTTPGIGVCSGDLGNRSETNLGAGDSGGPSFIKDANGKLYLVANNTFGGTFDGQVAGTFGTYSGGILLDSYLNWIYANSDAENVPEPALIGLFGLGALGLAARRRKAA